MLLRSLPRPVFVTAVILTTTLGMTWFACQGARSEITFKETLSDIPVTPPDTVPEISQESIDLALTMFSIEVPDSANHPTLDMDLKDRGLTVRAAFADKADVTVGPAAFESWGLLGSTLAHELEIHCQQSFTAIYILDLFGFDGTEAAEREAYQHELYSAKRFHLSHLDQTTIADTMTFYYPLATKREQTNLKPRVARWLAKNLLAPQRNSPKIPQP